MFDIIPHIPAWILISFGIVLIALEMITTAFVLIFFGLAFIIIGIVSFFIYMPGEVQILGAMVIGGALTFFLRRIILPLMRTDNLTLETLEVGEMGILSEYNGELRVNYKGTTWAIQIEDNNTFSKGDKVIVKELKNNVAIVVHPL